MKRRLSCSLLLLVMLLGALSSAWSQERKPEVVAVAPIAQATAEVVDQPAASSAAVQAPSVPYVEKDRTVFFIIGGAINVLALVVFIVWAVRQARQKNKQD